MATNRYNIKRYVRELLVAANTTAGNNIFFNSPNSIEPGPDNGIVRILSLSEVSDILQQAPRIYKKVFSVTLEISYAGNSGDDFVDERAFELFVGQVSDALEGNERFKNKDILSSIGVDDLHIMTTEFDGVEFRTEVGGQWPNYVALAKYDVCYQLSAGQSAPTADLTTVAVKQKTPPTEMSSEYSL